MLARSLGYFAAVLLSTAICILAGCGTSGTSGSSNGTGAVALNLVWNANKTVNKEIKAPSTVATIQIAVSGPSMTTIKQNFAAASGGGTISNVPAGSGIIVTASALDASGNLLYAGTVGNVTVVAGQTTDVVTVIMLPQSAYLMGGSIQSALYPTGDVTTFAGEAGNIGSNDAVYGPGFPASLNGPNGITSDGTNLYLTDSGNNIIRKIVIATGAVTTLAGTAETTGSTDAPAGSGSLASFDFPTGIATDGVNLYVTDTDNNTIRQIVIATGAVTTLAGTAGTQGSADAPSGPATSASFYHPLGITIDRTGTNLYVADSGNNTIRKIVIATGVVSTLAGTGSSGSADAPNGPGTTASFNGPFDITTDGTNLYVPDYYSNTIRKIVIATGAVTTLAGTAGTTGSTDAPTGPGSVASFSGPDSITTDGTNLYVADSGNNTIRKVVIASGAVTTLAGTAETTGGSTDAPTGPGSAASFNNPSCLAIVGANLYVADNGNDTVRQIVIASGAVTTLAGTAGTAGSVDNTASLYHPTGITTDGTNLYVSDTYNNTIRQIAISSGAVTTLAGTAGTAGSLDAPSGPGTSASFSNPYGITTDGTNLYVADYSNNTIREIAIATGYVTTLAGTAGTQGSTDAPNGPGTAASFYGPSDITTDGTNLYVADKNNNTIRKIVIATGAVTTLAGTAGTTGSTDAPTGPGTAASFSSPSRLTMDGTNLYVADTTNNTIRKIVIATGAVTTLAGTAGTTGSADSSKGPGSAASFNVPSGLTTDGRNLFVADYANNTIRQIVIATGAVTTLAGTPLSTGSADAPSGPGSAARFNGPNFITTDGASLYVTDSINNTIRKIR
jgi:DNA-binding beta-propeller fold protein YncE